MERPKRKQILLAQNFLKSPRLVHQLVARSTIDASDVVYEIGAGKGIITAELARVAKKVVAIEKDPRLVRRLRERFRKDDNVEIVGQDFLTHRIGVCRYKIFGSIPYNLTAHIVRKILYERPVPIESYLIMQKEAARRISGCPRETLFSLLAKPWFDFRIAGHLRRSDFEPVPAVDSVLLHIRRRKQPLIGKIDVALFRDFVRYGFCRWRPHLRSAYKKIFTYKQWKRMSLELGFPLDVTPTELSFEHWLGLFEAMKAKRRAAGG